ncbi:hypothetical protein ABZY03_09730 [Streptomyces klenkii]|uniref:hypothetical protein n=1 Tax=Streptomyces klenkii TaxID=1420899 RepID=UPI0033B274E9
MTVGIIVVPQQHRLIALSPAAAPVLLGLNSSALYIGVALGGGFGGLTQEWFGLAPAELGLVAAAVTALTLLWHLGTTRHPAAPAAPMTPEPTSAGRNRTDRSPLNLSVSLGRCRRDGRPDQ